MNINTFMLAAMIFAFALIGPLAHLMKPECPDGHVAVWAPYSAWACLSGMKP